MKIAIPITKADGPVPTHIPGLTDARLAEAHALVQGEIDRPDHDEATGKVLRMQRLAIEAEMVARYGSVEWFRERAKTTKKGAS